jgi:DNA-binding XRE family transcriptional regulator
MRPKTISWQEIKDRELTKEQQNELIQRVHLKIAMRKLKEEREKLGLTQQQLANKSGLPRTTISKIESGFQNISIQKLMQFAKALNKELEIKLVNP